MLRLTLVTCLSLIASPADRLPAETRHELAPIGEEKSLRALDAWMKLYRAGKIDFTSKTDISKDSLAIKFGLVAKGSLSTPTWAGDLETILDAVAKLDDGDAAKALLEVAAVGLDKATYEREMSPPAVREAGERWAATLRSSAAKEELSKAARGELKVSKNQAVAYRAAAAKCLGLTEDRTMLGTVEPLLKDPDELVRANAAEALARLADDKSAQPLIDLVEHETSDAVLLSAAQSLRTIFDKYVTADGKPPKEASADAKDAAAPQLPEGVRLAVQACIGALGRTNWRADMALVRFLDAFRSAESVPALITVLERFRDHPEEIKSGRLSGLLQFRVHELLQSMTGAVFAADQPDKWRQLWETEKDNLKVTEKHEPKRGGETSAGNFCGIPIEGTRVVFILDLSGSMDWNMVGKGGSGTGKKKGPSGLDFAKQELRRAMTAIAPNAFFNLITFNGDSKPELWNKDLVSANEKNRERFLKFVDGLKARGGTNLWGALEEALKMKSLVHNTHYESNVDEIFVLSDGAPSVGEIIDPLEILRLVKESNRFATARINTVFVNTEIPPDMRQAQPKMDIPPEELMKRMAEQNGGKFENL